MSNSIADELTRELRARGFDEALEAPQGTMALAELPTCGADLADLLDMMVARREKVFRSADIVGLESATKCYEDAILVVSAIKAVISRLTLTK